MSSPSDLTREDIAEIFAAGQRTHDAIVRQLGPDWDSPDRSDRDKLVARALNNLMGEMGEDIFAEAPEWIVELLATTGNELATVHLTRIRQRRLEEALGD